MEPRHLRDELANERTLLAWIRTNLALSAFGFVIARLGLSAGAFSAVPSSFGVSELVGFGFVASALASQILATQRYLKTRGSIETGGAAGTGSLAPMAVGLVAVALAFAAVTYFVLVSALGD